MKNFLHSAPTLSSLPLLTTVVLTAAVALTGCDTKSSNYNFNQESITPEVAVPHGPVFDPANKKIPSTNDLLFAGSKDGTLNIPNDADKDGKPDNPIIAQVNQLDGFSTTNPVTIDFGMDIDPTTLGDGVRVFQVIKDPQTGAVVSVTRELTAAEIVAVPTADKKLAIIPIKPFTESSSYVVVLTNAIKDTEGKKAETPAPYFLAKGSAPLTGGNYEALEPLRALINNMETKVVEFDDAIKKDDIIMSWSFTTQSISAVLNALVADLQVNKVKATDITMGTTSVGDSPLGAADIFVGTLKVPYYLDTPTAANPTGPLTGYWKGVGGSALTRHNTSPVKNSTLTIPVIMTVPKGATNAPIVIYQHGITRMRTDVLAYVDAMAQAGRAVIAIDLPLHGVPKLLEDGSDNPFYTTIEPTFGADYINNKTGAAGPDGVTDESGTHFMNLSSLLTSRDNIRQGVANLLVLRRSLENIPNINADDVGFVSHSLGGVVGVPYLGVETKEMPSSLVATGGTITKILTVTADDEAVGNEAKNFFGKKIKAGLAAAGVKDANYNSFMFAAQYILDSADPMNYAQDAATDHPIHLIEVLGDQTVRNEASTALAKLMGAKEVTSTVTDITKGKPGVVRFSKGHHSSVLTPKENRDDASELAPGNFIDVFSEIHKQLATFQATSGSTILITNDAIIKQ